MNKLPKTFCITLKETPLRTKGFLELAKRAGVEATIFHGAFGSGLGIAPKLSNDLENPHRKVFLNDAAMGCNMSHFILWNVLKYLPEDEFLVLEDDAILQEDFIPKFQELYARLPEGWQFAYVGWVPYGKDITPVIVDEGISIRLPSATHAYLVKKSALDILCSGLLPFHSPTDLTIIHNCLPKLKYYVFDPPIVHQRSYANTKDPVWMSLIYDWKADLYGFKRKILRDLNLSEGWHNLERTADTFWRWSQDRFIIQFPASTEKLGLLFSTAIKNSITISCNNTQTDFDLAEGENAIWIETHGAVFLIGKTHVPFIPSQHDSISQDSRSLGICLKSMIMEMGSTQMPISVSEV